jgi:hypothetical protein
LHPARQERRALRRVGAGWNEGSYLLLPVAK